MEITTVVTFDLNKIREISPNDFFVVQKGTIVRFELRANSFENVYRNFDDFVIRFELSPFKEENNQFKTKIPLESSQPTVVGEAKTNRTGEFKFSIGIQTNGKWEVEIDPILVVLPNDYPYRYWPIY